MRPAAYLHALAVEPDGEHAATGGKGGNLVVEGRHRLDGAVPPAQAQHLPAGRADQPLLRRREIVGVGEMINKKKGQFSEEDANL